MSGLAGWGLTNTACWYCGHLNIVPACLDWQLYFYPLIFSSRLPHQCQDCCRWSWGCFPAACSCVQTSQTCSSCQLCPGCSLVHVPTSETCSCIALATPPGQEEIAHWNSHPRISHLSQSMEAWASTVGNIFGLHEKTKKVNESYLHDMRHLSVPHARLSQIHDLL